MTVAPRISGRPTSSNGASSMHLFWSMPERTSDLIDVRATIEVLEPPPSGRLVFWALQVSFMNGSRAMGAGHFGLQHHPAYPSGGAVNWGGYHSPTSGRSGELDGSPLTAPSALANANTCNFEWHVGLPYTYRIALVRAGVWRGWIIDPVGVPIHVRDLHCEGTSLARPMVWTESFADCDNPSCAVRWSGLEARDFDGNVFQPDEVTVNYQREDDGGCSNTSASVERHGIVQRTNTDRSVPQGDRLPVLS